MSKVLYTNKIRRLALLEDEERRLDQIIDAGRENDPAEIERIKAEANKCKLASDRWTDNIFSLKKYVTKKFSCSSKDADKYLQITADFDYAIYVPDNKNKKQKRL